MNYQRLKKGLASLMFMFVFALPMVTVFESSAFAQGRHLGWYKQQQRQELRRMRQLERERQFRYRYQNNNRIVGYYDRFGRFHTVGYYDRFGRFHRY